jgi:acyl dehydratase
MRRLPDLRVTPDAGLPHRYAEISGDRNPIHTDPDFARAAGLPGPVLHGLYTMALVARGVTAGAGRSPLDLRSLDVQFRALAVPEIEITVSATAHDPSDGRRLVDCEACQGQARIIRRGRAELDA